MYVNRLITDASTISYLKMCENLFCYAFGYESLLTFVPQMGILIHKLTLPYPNRTIWKCSYNFSKPLQKYSPVCYCFSDFEDRTEEMGLPSAAPFLSCPAGLLIRGSAQRKIKRQLPHEKGNHTDRSALLAYARFRSRGGTACATGRSYRPAGVRAKFPGNQYRRKILLPGHAGRSGAAYTKGDYGWSVL